MDDEQVGGAEQPTARGVIGATARLTRILSEADLALFALVMGEVDVTQPPLMAPAPQTPSPEEASGEQSEAGEARQAAPPALLAALLTSVAAQHSDDPAQARFLETQLRFHAPARVGEELLASATVTALDDATHALRIAARCEAADGRRLAEADLLLQRDTPPLR